MGAEGTIIEASAQSLFVQADPSAVTEPLTCVGIGDITIPNGDRTITYCPSAISGEYDPVGFIRGAKDPVTLSLTRPLETVYNFLLEGGDCSSVYRMNNTCQGTSRTLVTNYLLGFLMYGGEFTTRTLAAPAALEPGENVRVNTSGEISALSIDFIKRLQSARQAMTQTQHANEITMLPRSCGTKCGLFRNLCAEGYMVLDTDYAGIYGDVVLYTADSGVTWTPTTTGPFSALGRNGTDVEVMRTAGGHRAIVSGGAVPGLPPEISYSDDGGVNWANVNPETVGSANRGVNRLAWDKLNRLWAAADDGRIYRTVDLGNTWTVAKGATAPVNDLNDIEFYTANIGYAVGDSNVVLQTLDGATWNALTGPVPGVNILSVSVNRFGHVFIGTNDARIFRSVDSGVNWSEMIDFGAGSVDKIEFEPYNAYVGYALWNDATPRATVKRTEDGGVTWVSGEIGLTTAANSGAYGLHVCDANGLFVVGDTVGGTTFAARFQRRAT